jgi:hypothetical protein
MAAMHLPPFHAMAIYSQIIFPLLSGVTAAVYPPVVKSAESLPTLPTPDGILDHIQRTKSNSLFAIPTLLQIWGQDQKSVDILSALQFVVRFDPFFVNIRENFELFVRPMPGVRWPLKSLNLWLPLV